MASPHEALRRELEKKGWWVYDRSPLKGKRPWSPPPCPKGCVVTSDVDGMIHIQTGGALFDAKDAEAFAKRILDEVEVCNALANKGTEDE